MDQVLLGIGIAVLIVAVLAAAGVMVMSRVRARVKTDTPVEGFTLSDLRRLRDQGKLSEEEFERARARMVERLHKSTAAQARSTAPTSETPIEQKPE